MRQRLLHPNRGKPSVQPAGQGRSPRGRLPRPRGGGRGPKSPARGAGPPGGPRRVGCEEGTGYLDMLATFDAENRAAAVARAAAEKAKDPGAAAPPGAEPLAMPELASPPTPVAPLACAAGPRKEPFLINLEQS